MSYFAALFVKATKLDAVVAAVRSAYTSIGGVESKIGTRVVVGSPRGGWSVITDDTRQTADLGVAAAIATELDTRVLAVGSRGSSSYGKAATKSFGTWPTKPPTSGKPSKILDALTRLGAKVPRPWEMMARDGVVLTFDLRKATLAPGPFKTNTADELAEADRGHHQDATWHIANDGLNGRYDDAHVAMGGLHTTWGWQDAFDHVMSSLQSHSMTLEPGSAKMFLALATRALDGITSQTLAERWEPGVGKGEWATIYFGLPLLCALVADDEATWKRLVARVAKAHRPRHGLYVWTKSLVTNVAMSAKARSWLERDLPVADVLAWARKAPHDQTQRWLDDAAQLAAREGDDRVLDRAFAEIPGDEYMAACLGREAYYLVRGKQFEPALRLYDRLIAVELSDPTIYTNALYAVQSDNSGMVIDPKRARAYIAAAMPHADANPAIYINIACVQLELGDRESMFAALEAAKRHKLRDGLAALRDEPMFKPLRRDPRFVALVGVKK